MLKSDSRSRPSRKDEMSNGIGLHTTAWKTDLERTPENPSSDIQIAFAGLSFVDTNLITRL